MAVTAAAALDFRIRAIDLILEIFQVPTIVHDNVSKLPLLVERKLCREKPSRSISRHAARQRALELLFGLAPHNHEHVVVAIRSGFHEECGFDHGCGLAAQGTQPSCHLTPNHWMDGCLQPTPSLGIIQNPLRQCRPIDASVGVEHRRSKQLRYGARPFVPWAVKLVDRLIGIEDRYPSSIQHPRHG